MVAYLVVPMRTDSVLCTPCFVLYRAAAEQNGEDDQQINIQQLRFVSQHYHIMRACLDNFF